MSKLDDIRARYAAVDPEHAASFKITPVDEFALLMTNAYGDIGYLLELLDGKHVDREALAQVPAV